MAEDKWEQRDKEKKERKKKKREALARILDGIGWGLCLVWSAVALLSGMRIYVALVGIGIVVVLLQLVRMLLGVQVKSLWGVIGLLFLVGGFCRMFRTEVPLMMTIMLLVSTGAVFASRFMPKR
jgi:hypothetical protein